MKIKNLFLGVLLAVAGAAQAQELELARTFKVGDVDNYKMNMKASIGAMGEVEMTFVSSQKVLKVYDNGDADIETAVKDMKLMMMGNEMPMPGDQEPPKTVQRVNKYGSPVGEVQGDAGMMRQMDFARFGAMFGKLKKGEDFPIDVKNEKTKKQEVKGVARLDTIENGVATVSSELDVYTEESTTPMKVKLKTMIDEKSSKVNKMTGTVTGLPSQGGMEIEKVDFVMERVTK